MNIMLSFFSFSFFFFGFLIQIIRFISSQKEKEKIYIWSDNFINFEFNILMFLDKKIMHAETKVRSDDKMRMKF